MIEWPSSWRNTSGPLAREDVITLYDSTTRITLNLTLTWIHHRDLQYDLVTAFIPSERRTSVIRIITYVSFSQTNKWIIWTSYLILSDNHIVLPAARTSQSPLRACHSILPSIRYHYGRVQIPCWFIIIIVGWSYARNSNTYFLGFPPTPIPLYLVCG